MVSISIFLPAFRPNLAAECGHPVDDSRTELGPGVEECVAQILESEPNLIRVDELLDESSLAGREPVSDVDKNPTNLALEFLIVGRI
jgi:hypothetical protein